MAESEEVVPKTDIDTIKCIFLCEFHPVAGPKITTQIPDDYITKETFATVNSYVIPRTQLQRSFLSV
jgi:nitrogen permease regulator 2-like protein